jgi:GMP synthase-like glutamine amidotransferase
MTVDGARTARVAFLQHSEQDVPGLLGVRARELGLGTRVHRADHGPASLPTPGSFELLVVMGSAESVTDDSIGWIGDERQLVARLVEAGVPVFGVCFGGQLLAQVLGGRVRRSARPEVGWRRVHSMDPDRIPPGPWLVWHEDEFTAPPGAEVLARTDASLRAYVHGAHTGVQFHPEVTADIVRDWIDDARAEERLGQTEASHLLAGFDPQGRGPEDQTRHLFDGFVDRAVGGR